MQIEKFRDNTALSHGAADWIVHQITDKLKDQEYFTLVLSGGNTPKALFELLGASPYKEKIPWTRLHIFWGDERAVPFTDSRNNAKMAFDTLLNHVPIPSDQIHIMKTDISPEQSAAQYSEILHRYFTETKASPSFDLVLLGMGDDGHTLSLFPGTEVVHEDVEWTKAYYLKEQDMYRITLTKVIVNRADKILFLISGDAKSEALKQVIQGDPNPDKYPSQVIKPSSDGLFFFVDEAAAAKLT